jgi:hypothetical protein
MVSPWLENGHLRWFLERNPDVDRCALVSSPFLLFNYGADILDVVPTNCEWSRLLTSIIYRK